MRKAPSIIMDFNHERLIFESPLQVWQTCKIEEVRGIFEDVQAAIDRQLYIVGYVAYECAPAFQEHQSVCEPDADFPLVWFASYLEPVEGGILAEAAADRIAADCCITDWLADKDRENYEQDIRTIHEAIARGETYQVNYTTRLRAGFTGDDLAYYEQLRDAQHGAYSAYLNLGRYRILSVSPELFFEWDGDTIRTKPMKGTAPKTESGEALHGSLKNRAENLMIVDLLRNDMSRIARTGTVRVPELFEIEEYPTLYQMTSTVEARTKPGTTLFDVFQAMFPCGSITGAPKISTMNIIRSLEREPRHIYCGTIGLIQPGREMTFNVAIRTVLVDSDKEQAVYGAGGGITWDSSAVDEYEELLTKSKILTYREQTNGRQHPSSANI
ncbi:aminodeoxychorismate synthase component I [Paenibacillus sp. FJAT-26967]|uniref:aminodeoxychorismate synthase component I n=1 Tax=Paenibacillus sp. FJAT-26967 TaxID=1729690 RepID=UPI00083841D8|nr:aminodeoxychorismate synthase component I [Paenibacillus sp. FJAT-26967]